MNITKRSGGYKVEIYDPSKTSRKRYVGTFPIEREAKRAGRDAEAEVAAQRGRRGAQTVSVFFETWKRQLWRRVNDTEDRLKESTVISYIEQAERFVDFFGKTDLRRVDTEFAFDWLLGNEDRPGQRWTHNGVRTMFTAARRGGLIDINPFTGLRLRGSKGRKDLDVLAEAQVHELAACAAKAWGNPQVVGMMHALILCAAFLGMRPAELYGLRWSDIDWANDELRVERQYSSKSRKLELPKNGLKRDIVLTPAPRAALLGLVRPIDPDALVFRAARGGPMSGRVQHYYWNPIRVKFGNPSMHLYELRHFCGSWLLNDLELPPQDVAVQLGHTDGGALVMKLYGHPSERLARKRIKERMAGGQVTALPTPTREAVGS